MEEAASKWQWLDRTKTGVEIVALCIAGLWGLKVYNETQAPAKEKRAEVTGKLEWTGITKDSCLAEYTVTFKNIGTTSIDLSAPQLSVWLSDEPNIPSLVKYLDPHELAKGKPAETVTLSPDEYGSHYAPGVGDTVTSVIHVKRNRARIIMVSLEFRQSEPNSGPWLDYRWDHPCGEEPNDDRQTAIRRRAAKR